VARNGWRAWRAAHQPARTASLARWSRRRAGTRPGRASIVVARGKIGIEKDVATRSPTGRTSVRKRRSAARTGKRRTGGGVEFFMACQLFELADTHKVFPESALSISDRAISSGTDSSPWL